MAFISGMIPGVVMGNYIIAIAGGAANVYLTIRAMKWMERVAKKLEKLINVFA
ncbi:MAG: hypothetical protein JZD41_07695 [Thermoproteus sp.]|nr:hypothetical protein [Thermoproteus sp.]